ncbi:MAG: MurR/RpiR family transcriptional regulator [Lactobacillus sp.]|nr:MurR/RpiR family transcriptional regulator [Lactobacillus sp.]
MLLIKKIEQEAITEKGSRREIANFLLQYDYRLATKTVDEIATQTFTSKASVVRFAKRLGFKGWREFCQEFSKEQQYLKVHKDDINANYPFKKEDTVPTILDNLMDLEIQALEITAHLFKQKNLVKAAEIIANSKLTTLYAESPNNYLAELFKRKLLSIGKQSVVFRDDELGMETGTLTQNDCAIIISYSGNEKSRAVRHINLLLSNKIPVIGITSNTDNFLREKANIGLLIASEENLYTKIAAFQTETSIEFILNVLFALVFRRDFDRNQYYHLDSARYLELNRKNNNLNS